MRYLLFLASLALFIPNAMAQKSLDEIYDNQEIIEISPVIHQGLYVSSSGGQKYASLICASVGASRLVKFEPTKVDVDAYFNPVGGHSISFNEFEHPSTAKKKVFKSITCAK